MEDKIKSQLAGLESKVDQLESELTHLDEVLRKCGFPNGITTLKSTIEELLSESQKKDDLSDRF